MIPAGGEPRGLDPERLGAFLLPESQREVVQDGERVGRVAGAEAGPVLGQGDIEHPLPAVFDGPVAADDGGEASRVGGQAAEDVSPLAGRVIPDRAFGFDADPRAQAGPAVAVGQPGEVLGRPAAPDFKAAVVAVDGLRRARGPPVEGVAARGLDEDVDVVVQEAVVALEAQAVVSPLSHGWSGRCRSDRPWRRWARGGRSAPRPRAPGDSP